jgi:type VI secretion system protein ImpB
MADSRQKFIGRNRAPRVQIQYEVGIGNATKTVRIPFVMGVLADLAGQPQGDDPTTGVDDRKFLEIDARNFDQRLKATKPHLAFQVPNTLTGDGELQIDITFESLEDFSPAAVARKVSGLKELLEARSQLDKLLTYMSGKPGAEDVIATLIQKPSIQRALASATKPEQQSDVENK